MRHLAAALACLALATASGCAVEVEGAACTTPGDRAACPDGQACGTGLTCSKRAAACTPCVAGAAACRAEELGHVYTCAAEGDPACGTLVAGDTCEAAQVCGGSGAGTSCRCATFTVDPAGATGEACRYTAIADAIAAAQALHATEVRLGGGVGQVYGDVTADRSGIAVPDGMTLRGEDATPMAANRIVLASGGGEGIRLGAGSALRGLTLRRAAAGPAVGVRVTGASPTGGPSLDTVAVDAAGAGGGFGTGVLVEGAGAVSIAGLVVSGATSVGLDVARADGDQAVTVSGGLLQGNATGVKLERGTLGLDGTRLFGSSGPGVQAAPASGDVARLTMTSVTVARGGNVGLVLQGLTALDLEQLQVCDNAGRSQTLAGVTRTAGGLLALGAVATTPVIRACRFFGNAGDQVVIGGSAAPWSLASSDCTGTGAAAPNVLTGYASPGVGLSAIASSVTVTRASWKSNSLPAASADYLLGAAGEVLDTENYCQPASPVPACPSAP